VRTVIRDRGIENFRIDCHRSLLELLRVEG
jgi:hypothetical protein